MATLTRITDASGWQHHCVRGFMATVRLRSARNGEGERVYRAAWREDCLKKHIFPVVIQHAPKVRVLILTMHATSQQVREMQEAGARGLEESHGRGTG